MRAVGQGIQMALSPQFMFGRMTMQPPTVTPEKPQGQRLRLRPVPGQAEPGRIPADGTTTREMLTQQNQGLPGPDVMQTPGGQYVNQVPDAGFGSAIYSDTMEGASGQGFTGQTVEGTGSISPFGFVASTTGSGPFGRNPEEQSAIEQRVAEIQRATDVIRGLRDVPTEQDRLAAQANQRVSLNQGLGSFINQASQRNFARERLSDLEQSNIDYAKLAQDAQQQGFDNALALQNVDKGRFKTTSIEGPDGFEVPLITDTATGETRVGEAPQRKLSPIEAESQARQEADQLNSERGGLFTGERDVFEGKTRSEWIRERVNQLTGSQGQEQQGGIPDYTDEDIENTARLYNVSPERVREIIGGR
jgi:hypothetical protein